MASVINSARKSSASVFDLIGNVTNAADQLLSTGTKAIAALDDTTTNMYLENHHKCVSDRPFIEDRAKATAVANHVKLMEDIHRDLYPDQEFDRDAHVKAAYQRLASID